MEKKMLVRDAMTKDVISIKPDTKIGEVAKILSEKRIHGVPVVAGGKLVGIITETDFFTKDSANLYLPAYIDFLKDAKYFKDISREEKEKVQKLLEAEAQDIMSHRCESVYPEMELEKFVEKLKEAKYSSFPVVNEENGLVGIITVADIVKLI